VAFPTVTFACGAAGAAGFGMGSLGGIGAAALSSCLVVPPVEQPTTIARQQIRSTGAR